MTAETLMLLMLACWILVTLIWFRVVIVQRRYIRKLEKTIEILERYWLEGDLDRGDHYKHQRKGKTQ